MAILFFLTQNSPEKIWPKLKKQIFRYIYTHTHSHKPSIDTIPIKKRNNMVQKFRSVSLRFM